MPWCGFNQQMAEGLRLFGTGLLIPYTKESDMPMCGYNPTMAQGLEEFAQGLAVQTDKRAVEEKVSVPQIPAIELAELDLFIASVRASSKQDELSGITGLAMFVRHLYARMQALTAVDPSMTAQAAFEKAIGQTNKLMFEMEDHYYSELRPKLGIKKAIAALGPFLEERV